MNFRELGAKLGLDESEYRELIELFMTSGTADFKTLADAVNAGDAEQAMRSAHTIKGASGNLGLLDIYETADFIETLAGSKQSDGLNQAVENMQGLLDAVQAAIEK